MCRKQSKLNKTAALALMGAAPTPGVHCVRTEVIGARTHLCSDSSLPSKIHSLTRSVGAKVKRCQLSGRHNREDVCCFFCRSRFSVAVSSSAAKNNKAFRDDGSVCSKQSMRPQQNETFPQSPPHQTRATTSRGEQTTGGG